MKTPMVINGNVVQLAGTSYQLSQINSVRVKPGRFRIIAFVVACFFGLGFLGSVLMAVMSKPDEKAISIAACLLYLALLAVALWRFVDGLRRHTLVLTVSNGDVAAMNSTSRPKLEAIASDLVGAISAR